MKKLINILFLFVGVVALAQKQTPAQMFASKIDVEDAKKHMEYLTSDELEGREAGTEGQKRAAVYLMQQFNHSGIPPFKGTYFQKFKLRVIKPDNITLFVNSKPHKYLESFLHNSDFEDSNFEDANLVFLGYGIESENYNDYAGVDVKDKVVMFLDGIPVNKKGVSLLGEAKKEASEWEQRKFKVEYAKKKGAKAVIVINEKVAHFKKTYAHFFSKEKMQLRDKPLEMPLPVLSVDDAFADSLLNIGGAMKISKIIKRIKKKRKPQSLDLGIKIGIKSSVIKDDVSSENIIGFIEGEEKKDEVIVITAHYDHLGKHHGQIFRGADDDASGTTALIELAQAFAIAKANGYGPKRSILFMPVSAEEKGLLGSMYYSENPLFPLKNTVANLNIDMIGRIDEYHENGNYVYIIGSNFLSDDLHEINESINEQFCKLELDYKFNSTDDPNRFYYRSDHYNFAKHNVPCIFYFNGVHEDYHKHTDTPDKIDYQKLVNITKLVYYVAWELANREERIKLNNPK